MNKIKPVNLNHRQCYNKRMVDLIKKIVCIYYNEPLISIDSKSRKLEVVHLRHTAAYMAFKFLDVRTTELGSYIGLDHSSIIHINKKFMGLLSWDKVLKKEFKDLEHIINVQYDNPDNVIDLDDFYFIDLNNIVSLRQNRKKAIIFSGYTAEEINLIKKIIGHANAPVETHTNTGIYIFKNEEI